MECCSNHSTPLPSPKNSKSFERNAPMTASDPKKVRIATVTVTEEQAKLLSPFFAGHEITHLPMDFEELIKPMAEPPHILVSALASASMNPLELAQVLRMMHPESRIFYVCPQRDGFDRKKL